MSVCTLRTRALAVTLMAIAAAFILVGCGGGGGGGASTPPTTSAAGRSYVFTKSGQVFAISVDSANRFTAFALDPGQLPGGAGAQGTLSTNGQFFAQSSDGKTQFYGTVSSDASSAVGTVKVNGQTVISFTAPVVSPGRSTPNGLTSTYSGSNASGTANLTVDATSHGTLWVTTSTTSGGGLLDIASDGTFSSSDGAIAGQITSSAGSFELKVTRLNNTAVNVDVTAAKVSRAKWTFLVFLNGANDLQNFGPLNVNQMEKVGSTADVNMVVQWKQADIRRECPSCGLPSFIGTRRYFITRDTDTTTVNSQLIQDMGTSVDMGDWRTLRDFVTWAQAQYPADHYALVIWNHGAGWRPTRSINNKMLPSFPRSVSIDDDTNNEIETWQLPSALSASQQLDMVVFDASLMQMVEVAYEMRNSTPIVVGSEESPPGEGYVYDTFLSDLVANPSMTSRQFATQIVNRTLQAYGPNGNNTQSAIDETKIQNVADNLNAFAGSLLNHISDSRQAMVDARNNADSYAYPENKDLWDYANIIKNETGANDLKQAASNVQAAIVGSLIAEAHGAQHANSHGLAVYVPRPDMYLTAYSNLALARVTNWPKWLQSQPLQ